MLIVNADDWGGSAAVTAAIDDCFAAGAITSATALVFMEDSERAAELAVGRGYPVGLHLNLTQPLSGRNIPAAVAERQQRACAHFANLRIRRYLLSPNPRVHALIADCIKDQLAEFQERYGRAPTHLDSHHHVHVCPDVFLSRAIAVGSALRQTISPGPDHLTVADWLDPGLQVSRAKHLVIAWRFSTTDRLWRPGEVYGGRGAVVIAQAARSARAECVEMMVHPQFEAERDLLGSEYWAESIAAAPLGSYADLPATARARIGSRRG